MPPTPFPALDPVGLLSIDLGRQRANIGTWIIGWGAGGDHVGNGADCHVKKDPGGGIYGTGLNMWLRAANV